MLQSLFKTRRQEPEVDETLEFSTICLLGRMEVMLERETMNKMRFATLDNNTTYMR
jgi:hypothetical protein